MNRPAIHRFITGCLLICILCSGIADASDDVERERFISELQRGLGYHDDGKTNEAILLIENASDTYLHTNWSYYICGYLLSELGDDERALIQLDRALETDDTYARAWYYKGKVLSNLGRDREAEVCFLRAEELDERYEIPWTEKWPYNVIFRHLTIIYSVLAFGTLGIYIYRRERRLR